MHQPKAHPRALLEPQIMGLLDMRNTQRTGPNPLRARQEMSALNVRRLPHPLESAYFSFEMPGCPVGECRHELRSSLRRGEGRREGAGESLAVSSTTVPLAAIVAANTSSHKPSGHVREGATSCTPGIGTHRSGRRRGSWTASETMVRPSSPTCSSTPTRPAPTHPLEDGGKRALQPAESGQRWRFRPCVQKPPKTGQKDPRLVFLRIAIFQVFWR
jgi:hypothetical protein